MAPINASLEATALAFVRAAAKNQIDMEGEVVLGSTGKQNFTQEPTNSTLQ